MANLKVTWTLPTTRESTKPLNPADIRGVEIQLSADLGTTFTKLEEYPPAVLETVITELEPGEWRVRGIVYDTNNRASKPLVATLVIPDNTAPGALTQLTLDLV
jgi:hypothetical protein